MTIRKLDAARGAGWITDGLAVFKASPGTYLTGCLVVGLISSLPLVGVFFGLLMPVMYGGLLSMLQHQSRGEPTATGQIFDGFQKPGAFSRLLPIVLLNLAFAIVLVIILAVTIGVAVYQLIRAGQMHEQPDPQMVLALLPKFALLFLILLPIGMFYSWVIMLATPRAMLGNVPGMTAVREAVSAVMANILPFLVNFLCLMLLMFVIVLIMMIPFMLMGVVQQHSFFLGMLLQIPVMAVFTGGILALNCAIMFQAWREVFGEETDAPSEPPTAFEA
jgi:hypothetical protein